MRERRMGEAEDNGVRHNPIGISTYSFWQFNGPKENTPIEYCIEPNHQGYFSLEPEGNEDPLKAVPRGPKVLQEDFNYHTV